MCVLVHLHLPCEKVEKVERVKHDDIHILQRVYLPFVCMCLSASPGPDEMETLPMDLNMDDAWGGSMHVETTMHEKKMKKFPYLRRMFMKCSPRESQLPKRSPCVSPMLVEQKPRMEKMMTR